MPTDHFGTENFGKSHFDTDVSSREHFGTCTVRRCGCSGRWTFQQGNLSTWGNIGTVNFRHNEFSAQEHFGGTWIFWHPAKQYGRFGIDILAPVLLCQNVHVPKIPRAEKSRCQNVPVHLPERLQRQMVHVPKCSRDETSMRK